MTANSSYHLVICSFSILKYFSSHLPCRCILPMGDYTTSPIPKPKGRFFEVQRKNQTMTKTTKQSVWGHSTQRAKMQQEKDWVTCPAFKSCTVRLYWNDWCISFFFFNNKISLYKALSLFLFFLLPQSPGKIKNCNVIFLLSFLTVRSSSKFKQYAVTFVLFLVFSIWWRVYNV